MFGDQCLELVQDVVLIRDEDAIITLVGTSENV